MPSAHWSPTGVFTIVSLVTLCLLSFIVVLGSDNTQVLDTVYAFPKRDTPNHHRAFHHARAPLPQAPAAPPSNVAQPASPAATPIPVQPSTPAKQALAPSQNPNPAPQQAPAPSPAPAPAPSPAPAPQPSQPQPQAPAQSSPPAAVPSPAAPPPSNAPAAAPPASSAAPGSATALPASAPLSQNSSSSQGPKTVSNIGNYSATGYSYSYQPATITALGGVNSTTSRPLSNTFAPQSTARANPTAPPKGFFANKAGVGVTFGIVGSIVAICLVLAIRMLFKRYRKSRDAKEVDEWFEKRSAGHGSSNWHGDGQYATNTDEFGSGSRRSAYGVRASDAGAAAAAMTSADPDAYPDRSVHFGGRPTSTASLGVVLPPSLNFAGIGGVVPQSPKPSHSSLRNSWTPSQTGVPYAAPGPSNTAYAAAAPRASPQPYPPAVHGQEQVNDVANGDPYYRTNAAGVGAAHLGYAQ